MRKKSSGGGEPIETWDGVFADPEVGRVLHANGLIADANISSIEELATITRLNRFSNVIYGYFYNNKVITKFPELQYCTGISSLYGTFSNCSNLTEVTIPDGVTDMNNTFYRCTNLTEVGIIPEGVRDMTSTFDGCSNLIETPTIPESVTDMTGTFRNCSSLDGIFVIKRVTPPFYSSTFTGANVVTIYVPDESVDTYKTTQRWSAHSSIIYPISQLPE